MKNQQIAGAIFLWMATITILLEPQPLSRLVEIIVGIIGAVGIMLLFDWQEGKK